MEKNKSMTLFFILLIITLLSTTVLSIIPGPGDWAYQNDGSGIQLDGYGSFINSANEDKSVTKTVAITNQTNSRNIHTADIDNDGFNEIITLTDKNLIIYNADDGNNVSILRDGIIYSSYYNVSDINYPNASAVISPVDSDISVNKIGSNTYITFLIRFTYSNYSKNSSLYLAVFNYQQDSTYTQLIADEITADAQGMNCIDGIEMMCPVIYNCTSGLCTDSKYVSYNIDTDSFYVYTPTPKSPVGGSDIKLGRAQVQFTWADPSCWEQQCAPCGFGCYQCNTVPCPPGTYTMDTHKYMSPITIDTNNDGIKDFIFSYKNMTSNITGYIIENGADFTEMNRKTFTNSNFSISSLIAEKYGTGNTSTRICAAISNAKNQTIYCYGATGTQLHYLSNNADLASGIRNQFNGIAFGKMYGESIIATTYIYGTTPTFILKILYTSGPWNGWVIYWTVSGQDANPNGNNLFTANIKNDNCTDFILGRSYLYIQNCVSNWADLTLYRGLFDGSELTNMFSFATDINGDRKQDVVYSTTTKIMPIYATQNGVLLNMTNIPSLHLGYNYSVGNVSNYYSGFFGYYDKVLCMNTTQTFKAQECGNLSDLGVNISCNYYNENRTEQERLVTDCGRDLNLTYGNWSNSAPQVSCGYNQTGSYSVKLYLQKNTTPNNFGVYNKDDISFTVTSSNVSCNEYQKNDTRHNNFTPIMNSSYILPVDPTEDNTLEFYCKASDGDGQYLSYLYQIFKNNNTNVYTQGLSSWNKESTPALVYTIPSNLLVRGDNYSLSCKAYDWYNYSSWLNTTNTTILPGEFAGYTQLWNWTDISTKVTNTTGKYILMKNLTASDSDYNGIGNSWTSLINGQVFGGTFNGNGNSIHNIIITGANSRNALFALTSGTIKNINMVNMSITTTGDYAAGIVGNLNSPGTIVNCSASGNIIVNTTYISYVGGLVGYSLQGKINNSWSNMTINVYSNNISGTGGIAGYVSGGNIYNTYAIGSIINGTKNIGGLIGKLSGGASVWNSYSISKVINTSINAGPVIGYDDSGFTVSNYWDMNTSEIYSAGEGTGKTTQEMKNISTYSNWYIAYSNFTTSRNNGYPYLGQEINSSVSIWLIDNPLIIGNIGPVINSSRLSPSVAYTNDTLRMYCNATDSDSINISYNYKLFANDEISLQGLTGDRDRGIEVEVATKYPLQKLTTYILECQAYDGVTYSTKLNSTPVITGNYVPQVTSASLSPTSLQYNKNITIIYTCTDGDAQDTCDSVKEFNWYQNGVNQNLNSQLLFNTTISVGDNITGYVRVNDGVNWSDWVNTSTKQVQDEVLPVLTLVTVNPTSFYTLDSTTIDATCTDATGIDSVVVEITDPGFNVVNYSMPNVGGDIFEKVYTAQTDGFYTAKVYCTDDSLNTINSSTYNFTTSEAPIAPPAGGGGGGGIETKNITITVTPSIQRLYVSAGETKNNIEYKITNEGVDNVSVIMTVAAGSDYVNWVSFDDDTKSSYITIEGNKAAQLSKPVKYIRYKVKVPEGVQNGDYKSMINLITDAGVVKYNINIVVSDSQWLFITELANNKFWEYNQTVCLDKVQKVNVTCVETKNIYKSVSVLNIIIISLILLLIIAAIIYYSRRKK